MLQLNKRWVQGVFVFGWLVWSFPALGSGEHVPQEGHKTGHGPGKHGGYGGAGKKSNGKQL